MHFNSSTNQQKHFRIYLFTSFNRPKTISATLFLRSLEHHVNRDWNYISETKGSFSNRGKEHIRNTKQYAKGSNVGKYAWTFDHVIDFDNSTIVDKGNHCTRKTHSKNC